MAGTITPGATAYGSWAATDTPAAQGSAESYGYGAKAIARWDVVPYQTITGTLRLGVVAYHCAGVAKISFACNGGSFVDVTATETNSETGEVEYCADLAAAAFAASGPCEVRAIAYPVVGECRVLDSLHLFIDTGDSAGTVVYADASAADDTGTGLTALSPKKYIVSAMRVATASNRCDGAIIKLAAGSYKYGYISGSGELLPHMQTWYRWVTIQPQDEVATSSVLIDSSDTTFGLLTQLVHLKDITLKASLGTGSTQDGPAGAGTTTPKLWLDGVAMVGADNTTLITWTVANWGYEGTYLTDCTTETTKRGVARVKLVRNCTFTDLGIDPMEDCQMALSVTVRGISPEGGDHPDVFQITNTASKTFENLIYRGIDANGVAGTGGVNAELFIMGSGSVGSTTINNVAIVDCDMDGTLGRTENGFTTPWIVTAEHVYMHGNTFAGQQMSFRDNAGPTPDETSSYTYLHFMDNAFYYLDFPNTGNDAEADATNRLYSNTYDTGSDQDNISAPTVTTTAASSVDNDSAVLGGEVTDDGGGTVTECGICWNTTGDPDIADTKVAIGTGTGAFSDTVGSLPAGTTIYFNAYATNSVGTSYGTADDFTTIAGDPYTTPAGTIAADGETLTLTWTRAGGWPEDMTGYNTAACTVTAGGRTILATTGADASVDGETLSVERTLASVVYAGETCTVEVEAGQVYSDENSETIRTEAVPAGTALTNGSSVVLPGAFGSHGKQQVGTTGVYGYHGKRPWQKRT